MYDVLIIGAGAAGLMCGLQAGKNGKKVLILEKTDQAGKKILISGGGACNFTNLNIDPEAYISQNPHFCKSFLTKYSQWDFINMLENHGLSYREKELGQLFCDQKSTAVLQMLLDECQKYKVKIALNERVSDIEKQDNSYKITSNNKNYLSKKLVIATGGASIAKIGASDFGLQIAKKFKLKSVGFKPALVPFIFHQQDISRYFYELSGVAINASLECNNVVFSGAMLITHRGISGPIALQISSYWKNGDKIIVNLLPEINATEFLLQQQQSNGKQALKTILATKFASRLAVKLGDNLLDEKLSAKSMGEINIGTIKKLGAILNHWELSPSGTEGMRTAEVCTGGVSTSELNAKTLESLKHQGLFFIGEVVDVTGWLGGYNFQWAWSSGAAAGRAI